MKATVRTGTRNIIIHSNLKRYPPPVRAFQNELPNLKTAFRVARAASLFASPTPLQARPAAPRPPHIPPAPTRTKPACYHLPAPPSARATLSNPTRAPVSVAKARRVESNHRLAFPLPHTNQARPAGRPPHLCADAIRARRLIVTRSARARDRRPIRACRRLEVRRFVLGVGTLGCSNGWPSRAHDPAPASAAHAAAAQRRLRAGLHAISALARYSPSGYLSTRPRHRLHSEKNSRLFCI
jgi:hypothetical protein